MTEGSRAYWPRWLHTVLGPADWPVTVVEKPPGGHLWHGRIRDVVMDGTRPLALILDIVQDGDPHIVTIAWDAIAAVNRDTQPEDDGHTESPIPWRTGQAGDLTTEHLGWEVRIPTDPDDVDHNIVQGSLVMVRQENDRLIGVGVGRSGQSDWRATLARTHSIALRPAG
jgi:hypothetical protein